MSVVRSECRAAKYLSMPLAVATCAFGRAVDFATTWVALRKGFATEAKVGTAQLFQFLGPHWGLIAYEALVTTPAIFLGCYLIQRSRDQHSPKGSTDHAAKLAERMFFFSIGVISLIVAAHNTTFLL
ncbi:MAG TPA: hypothetical protein VL171_03060 [Verrucomicrobiae bacterium]|nr:hypothetical protein [Verrucomicrobiae bacterium]